MNGLFQCIPALSLRYSFRNDVILRAFLLQSLNIGEISFANPLRALRFVFLLIQTIENKHVIQKKRSWGYIFAGL